MIFRTFQSFVEENSNSFIFLCHLALAGFFFSNYFLFHQVLIYSTDVLHLNFPLLIQAKRNFLEGNLGLWNPYIGAGVSIFSSSNFPILSPDNWLHFLFPEKYFFIAATFFSFIKFWLIGVFSFLLFYEELKIKKWAFWTSILYQFSGYTIWALLVYDVLSMILFLTIALYLVWTFHKRSLCLNYFYLVLSLVLLVLSSNISYTTHSLILVCLLSLYRWIGSDKLQRGAHFCFCLCMAFCTSLLISLPRILPVWMEIKNSNRSLVFDPSFKETSFLGLRLFDPEVLGVSYVSSMSIIEGLDSVLKGIQIHSAMPQYFGVLSILLVLWALLTPQKGSVNLLKIYVVVFLGALVFVEPFETIFKVLNPAYHPLSLHVFLPIGFCLLAGHSAKALEEKGEDACLESHWVGVFAFILASIFFYILAVWVIQLSPWMKYLRFMGWIGVALFFCCWWVWRCHPKWFLRLGKNFIAILIAGLIFLVFVFDHSNKTYLSHVKILSASLILLASLLWLVLRELRFHREIETKDWVSGISVVAVLLFVMLYPWSVDIHELPGKRADFVLAMLGLVRLILVASLFGCVLFFLKEKRFDSKYLFPLFLAVLIFDQLPASKIHSHIVLNPFSEESTAYPPPSANYADMEGNLIDLETDNYRFNKPSSMLRLPFYSRIYGDDEILSSIFSIYNIRSYGGHYNVLTSRYFNFIKGLIPGIDEGFIQYGAYTQVDDNRFLDLLGVGYEYIGYDHESDTKTIKYRPQALSRFMLFHSYEVISEEIEIFKRLRDPDLELLRTLALNENPGIPNLRETKAVKIKEYEELSTDEIKVHVSSHAQGLLLFNDSYNEGWKAFVNGVEAPIISANYNFMATVIPEGDSEVVFRFDPKFFGYSLYALCVGLGLLVLFTGIFYFKGKGVKLQSPIVL